MSQVWSPSFVITADDGDSDAEARAKAVAGTCETDLKWLEAIFRGEFARNK